VRPNNWLGYQTCGILTNELEYKMDDDDCGKIYHGYICADIREFSLSSSLSSSSIPSSFMFFFLIDCHCHSLVL